MKAFLGGIHPPGFKDITKDKKIRHAGIPKKAVLPLSQHTGRPSEPIVKPGEDVCVGQMIAKATGFISSNLHSSISGKVLAIEQAPHPVFGRFMAIIVEADVGAGLKPAPTQYDIDKLSPETVIQAISEAGIVGMGGAGFPTHVKLSPPKEKKIDTLIINGAECEPYLTCDYRLMLERPEDILKGIEIIAKALGVRNIIIGIEDNKPDAIEAMRDVVGAGLKPAPTFNVNVIPLPTKYPQGGEKQLIKALTGKEVPSGGLPFDAGVVVQNVATALAVYEAIVLNKPLYERVLTVSGDCIKEPANLLVKIGTPISDLVEECGGFVKEPKKIIFGGPMMGVAQAGLDAPVLKGTSGVLFLSRGALQRAHSMPYEESICIRCGRCVRACPAGISPMSIYYAAVNRRFELADAYNAIDCIECGCCSFECPANLELAGMIKYAKLMIKK